MKTQAATAFPASIKSKPGPLPSVKKSKSKTKKCSNLDKSWTLGHPLLTVHETADRLGVSHKTITRWCETGKLPATLKPFGVKTTYLINPLILKSIESLTKGDSEEKTDLVEDKCVPTDHSLFLSEWVIAMERGLITGKPYSDSTIEMYTFYSTEFLQSHKVVSSKNLRSILMSIPKEAWAKRFKMYKAVVSFAKYLFMEEQLDKVFLDEVKPLYPKRHTPPKQLVIDEAELQQLLAVATTPLQRALILFFGNTGLRVSEVSKLLRSDIDFEKQCLRVLGKGNKYRRLGLSEALLSVLATYFKEGKKSRWLFADENGKGLSRMALYTRLKLLGKKAKIDVTPHVLRRAFVTINANKGRPLPMLQIACGHSSIKTTMTYCKTTEQEVVEAMKGWS